MERVLLSFTVIGKAFTLDAYQVLLGLVFLIYTLLWGGYMASWRNALYGIEKKHYPPYFQKFLANQKLLLLLLAIPIVQIPWIFILLFALRRALLNRGKGYSANHGFLFFHLGVFVMLLQFLGFGLLTRAATNDEKWLAMIIQFFILGLALWQWLLVHRLGLYLNGGQSGQMPK